MLSQNSGFNILQIGIVQFIITAIFFFAFLGTFPLFFGWDEYRVNAGVNDQLIILKVMLFSGFTMFFLIFGAIFAKSFFKNPATLNSFHNVQYSKIETIILLLLLLFVIFIVSIYVSKIPRIALLVSIIDGAQESHIARSAMGNSFSGKYHWYSLIMHDLANVIVFSFFAIFLLKKEKKYFILFTFSFLVSGFTALMAAQKAPIGWLFIGLFMVFVAIRRRGLYPIGKVAIFSVFIFSLLALTYKYFMGSSDLSIAFSNVFSRAFAGSIQPAYHYLEFFPANHDFLYGASFPNPGGILPYEPFALSKEVMSWVNPGDLKEGVVGSMPTIFWGEAYANFGYVGIAIIPFVLGFIAYTVDILVSKIADSPLKVGFYVWLLIHYKGLAISGFSTYLIDFYLVFIIFIVLLVLALSNNFKIKLKGIRNK